MGNAGEKLGHCDFTDREFKDAIFNFLTADQGHEDFSKLVSEAAKCSKIFRYSIPLLGTFEREERELTEQDKPKKNRFRGKGTSDNLKKPDKIAAMRKADKGAEKINSYQVQIERICKERDGEEIPYYELITHPTDFMITVDNAFQISFLIRDSLIGLKKEHDGEPIVHLTGIPINRSQFRQHGTQDTETIQCVVSLNPKIWQENVEKYRIREPLLTSNVQSGESNTQATQS